MLDGLLYIDPIVLIIFSGTDDTPLYFTYHLCHP